MTATHDVLPNTNEGFEDTTGLEEVLDRWSARTTSFRASASEAVAFRDELVAAGVVNALTGGEAAALRLVRRIAFVSLELGRAAADHVQAVAHVRRNGTPAQLDSVLQAALVGLATGWAHRTPEDTPGLAADLAVAPIILRDDFSLAAYVAPVDRANGARATALIPVSGNEEPAGFAGAEQLLDAQAGGSARSAADLGHGAVSLGVAERLLSAAAHSARTHGRPWSGRTYDRLIDDPYVILRFGRLRADLNATGHLLDDTLGGPRAELPTAPAILKTAAASILTAVTAELPELVGVTGVAEDELWAAARSARSHALTDSAAWNEAVAGQELLAQPVGVTSESAAEPVAEIPVLADDTEATAAAAGLARRLAHGAAARDAERSHPVEELRDLARTGLLGITVPAAFGGAEVSTRTVAEVVRLIATADGSIAQMLHPHFTALEMIRLSGTPAQQRLFFAEALAGARFGNANAELGTKAAGDIRTRLLHSPDGGFTVDGTKAYTTGSYSADWIPVTVRDPAGNRASALVLRDAEGVEVVDDWSGIGQRTTASGTTTLTGVRVFEQHVIAQWRAGEGAHLSGAKGNIVHGAVNIGIAAGALEATRDYVVTRARPSKDLPIESVVEDPHVTRRFGRLAARLAVAESALARAAGLVDEAERSGTPQGVSAATVAAAETEALGSEIALEISSELFALSGASSSRSELGFDRFWRDVRTHSLHDTMIWKFHQSGDALLSGAYYFGNRRTVF